MSDEAGVQYRPIAGYPAYRIGSDGSVWTCWRNRGGNHEPRWLMDGPWKERKPGRGRGGYKRVNLRREDGKVLNRWIAHLVLEAFVGPKPDGMEACHDPDPSLDNNRLENLRWDTHESNLADSIRIRRASGVRKPRPSHWGENSPFAKITESDVIEIRRLLAAGMQNKDVAVIFNLHKKHVSRIKIGTSWKHLGGVLPRGRNKAV